MMPSARAAHARISGSARRPQKLRPIEQLVERRDAGVARERAVRLEVRHLLGEVRALHRLPLHHRFHARQRGAVPAHADRAHRRDAHVAIIVVERRLEQPQRARRPDLRQRLRSGLPQLDVRLLQHLRERRHGRRRLELARAPHCLDRDCTDRMSRSASSSPRCSTTPCASATRSSAVRSSRLLRLLEPSEHRAEHAAAQLIEQRVELGLLRDHLRLVESLEQLREHRRDRSGSWAARADAACARGASATARPIELLRLRAADRQPIRTRRPRAG